MLRRDVLNWKRASGMELADVQATAGTARGTSPGNSREVSHAMGEQSAVRAEAGAGRQQRIPFIDVAKGIGIILVVIGHSLGGMRDADLITDQSLPGLAFYFIYTFHMPLFFFLSGCLVESRITKRPGRFLRSSLTRIAYPYFLWGLIYSAVRILTSGVTNHPEVSSPAQEVAKMFWSPPGPFWFLYVLFFLHMTSLVSLRVGGKPMLLLLCAMLYAVCAVWQPASDFLWHYVAGTNILFYVIGVSRECGVLGYFLAARDVRS